VPAVAPEGTRVTDMLGQGKSLKAWADPSVVDQLTLRVRPASPSRMPRVELFEGEIVWR
jgi:hypothetical protein